MDEIEACIRSSHKLQQFTINAHFMNTFTQFSLVVLLLSHITSIVSHKPHEPIIKKIECAKFLKADNFTHKTVNVNNSRKPFDMNKLFWLKSKNKKDYILNSEFELNSNNNEQSLIVVKNINYKINETKDARIAKTTTHSSQARRNTTTKQSLANMKHTYQLFGLTSDELHNEHLQRNGGFTSDADKQELLQLVMNGLGLRKLPNMNKVNISQQEYATKYSEYLSRVTRQELANAAPLNILSITTNNSTNRVYSKSRQKRYDDSNTSARDAHHHKEKTIMFLHFPIQFEANQRLQHDDIEEANVRLMLIHSPSLALSYQKKSSARRRQCSGKHFQKHSKKPKHHHLLNLKVYQLLQHGKRLWLDGIKMGIDNERGSAEDTKSHWLQFDVTKAVEMWLRDYETNLGLELQCDNCKRNGARFVPNFVAGSDGDRINHDDDDDDDDRFQLMPVLNLIGRFGVTRHEMRTPKLRMTSTSAATTGAPARISNCYKTNQRCCRHSMEVVFKEIKGFEFIIQPKVFDAGYCKGRCPPRFNPAHHHAMLQGLIWKQSRTRAPRPCCAPSKLIELEILHVDEQNSEKLKISTWRDMQVVECACS